MAEALSIAIAFGVMVSICTLLGLWIRRENRKAVSREPVRKRASSTDVIRDAYRQKSDARRVLAKQWDDQFVQLWIEHGPKYRMGSDTIRDVQMLREMLEKNEYEMRMHRALGRRAS